MITKCTREIVRRKRDSEKKTTLKWLGFIVNKGNRVRYTVKTLGSDKDILGMLSNLPRHHYVHVYLDEVRPYQFNVDNVELNDEPIVKESLVEPIVEENFVEPKTNDNVDEEHSVEVYISEPSVEENFVEPEIDDNVDEEHSVEVNIGEPSDDGNVVDSNSDSEDIDYEVSKSTSYESGFTDTENESDFEGVGDNVTREESHKHNWKGSDEIMVDSDPESGHSDSFHSLDEAGNIKATVQGQANLHQQFILLD
ncbi:hypothetical protein V6N11_025794 [Hibiscus sabdariffa]|uniref:Uncharacterized protein n=1 Tax=Hibiscus sabdariffa TaxID=183260 RepID=A0ABR2SUN1_9ROSI